MELEVGFKYREEIVAQKDKLAMEMHVEPYFKGVDFSKEDFSNVSKVMVSALGKRRIGRLRKELKMEIMP